MEIMLRNFVTFLAAFLVTVGGFYAFDSGVVYAERSPGGLPANAPEADLKFQPATDYDTDGCYPTPAIGPDGKINPGKNLGGALNGECRDEVDLDDANIYSRSKCNKVVYHKDGGFTHVFRHANSGDEPPENHKGTWHLPKVIGWNHFPPGFRDKLVSADFGSASLKLKDGTFEDTLAKAKPSEVPLDPKAAGSTRNVKLKTLGNVEGSRFLDGRTGDGTVGLAPSTDGNFSGTKWQMDDF